MRRRVLGGALAVVLALVGSGAAAPGALAHSNRSVVRLAVTPTAQDGRVTLSAFLVYADDHEPVADEFVLAEISGAWGRRSLQLPPERQVPGMFSAPVHLAPGTWHVLVAAKAATAGQATGTVTMGADGTVQRSVLSASFDPASVAASSGSGGGSGSLLVAVGLVGVMLVVAAAVAVRLHQRRADPSPTDVVDMSAEPAPLP